MTARILTNAGARRSGNRAMRMTLLSMAVAAAAALATSAWAHAGGASAMGGQPMMAGHGMGGHGMHGGMGHGMRAAGGRHGSMHDGGGMMMFGGSPERMARRLDFMLDGLNATDAQRTQIKKIAETAAADLRTQREAGRGLREKAMQIFTAPNVDAAAAESLRQQMLAQHDQRSKRSTQAMLEISQVLTPEQRTKLGQRIEQRRAQQQERMQRMQRERKPG